MSSSKFLLSIQLNMKIQLFSLFPSVDPPPQFTDTLPN